MQPFRDLFVSPCREVDPDLFFPETQDEVEAAKKICLGCPLIVECLSGAKVRGEPHGIWGGELFYEGTVIAHKRGRGRPRKERPVGAGTPNWDAA